MCPANMYYTITPPFKSCSSSELCSYELISGHDMISTVDAIIPAIALPVCALHIFTLRYSPIWAHFLGIVGPYEEGVSLAATSITWSERKTEIGPVLVPLVARCTMEFYFVGEKFKWTTRQCNLEGDTWNICRYQKTLLLSLKYKYGCLT